MLVLSRKMHEVILIGDDITIEVCGIEGSRVRLGVEAPNALGVHRQEVYHERHRGTAHPFTPGRSGVRCRLCGQGPLAIDHQTPTVTRIG